MSRKLDKLFNKDKKIIIPELLKLWKREPERWSIKQWHDEYTLYRVIYKNRTSIRCGLTIEQAQELILNLGLVNMKSGSFKHGSFWRIYNDL